MIQKFDPPLDFFSMRIIEKTNEGFLQHDYTNIKKRRVSPMNLTAYTPFDSQIDRLFTDAFQKVGNYVPSWVPTCNGWEDSEKFVLELALPGWKTEEVKLALENGILTVEGMRETADPSEEGDKRIYHIREVESGSFSRSFRLPPSMSDGSGLERFQRLIELQSDGVWHHPASGIRSSAYHP